MTTPNRAYWLARDGSAYALQQAARTAAGNASYRQQEDWLVRFLEAESARLCRKIKVLDCGVGFGRMTRLLAGRQHIEYHGYDISNRMVRPLLEAPPESLPENISERIHIGEDVRHALAGHSFDVIFTVSVFIHNTPEQARELLEGLRALIVPKGTICLIENRPVSISMHTSEWHGGCWSHDVALTLAADMDVDVDDGILTDHGVYLLREPADRKRMIRVPGESGFEPVGAAEYMLRVRPRTVSLVTDLLGGRDVNPASLARDLDDVELYRAAVIQLGGMQSQIDTMGGELLSEHDRPARVRDLPSALSLLPVLLRRLHESVAAASEAEEAGRVLREELVKAQAEVAQQSRLMQALSWQLGVRQRIATALREPLPEMKPERRREKTSDASIPEAVRPQMPFEYNALRDTRYAQPLVGHERVCHVMHQQWFGMRSACGALPGQKLAVSADLLPSSADVEKAVELLSASGVDRLVLHGFSDAMAAWAKALAAAGMRHIFLVWHGAPVMWVHDQERALFKAVLDLVRKGVIKRVHGMRPGMHPALGKAAWIPQIYNMPPRYTCGAAPRDAEHVIALVPSWNLVHKNLYTNIAAADFSGRVGEIWTLAESCDPPWTPSKPIKSLPRLSQSEMLETMELSDVVMNASIVDCHPMVELEALAAGRPAVRGRLGLDALEDHSYVRLTQVDDPLSIVDVRRVLERVLSVPKDEMGGIINDYSCKLVGLSFDRYSAMMEV